MSTSSDPLRDGLVQAVLPVRGITDDTRPVRGGGIRPAPPDRLGPGDDRQRGTGSQIASTSREPFAELSLEELFGPGPD